MPTHCSQCTFYWARLYSSVNIHCLTPEHVPVVHDLPLTSATDHNNPGDFNTSMASYSTSHLSHWGHQRLLDLRLNLWFFCSKRRHVQVLIATAASPSTSCAALGTYLYPIMWNWQHKKVYNVCINCHESWIWSCFKWQLSTYCRSWPCPQAISLSIQSNIKPISPNWAYLRRFIQKVRSWLFLSFWGKKII